MQYAVETTLNTKYLYQFGAYRSAQQLFICFTLLFGTDEWLLPIMHLAHLLASVLYWITWRTTIVELSASASFDAVHFEFQQESLKGVNLKVDPVKLATCYFTNAILDADGRSTKMLENAWKGAGDPESVDLHFTTC